MNFRVSMWSGLIVILGSMQMVASGQTFTRVSRADSFRYGADAYDSQAAAGPQAHFGYVYPRHFSYRGFSGGTIFESHARGLSSLIRAQSLAQIDLAIARSESEQARRMTIENDLIATRAFLEQRQLRDRFRESADNSFYKSKAKLAAYVAKRKLEPLGPDELDPISGEIRWPVLLETQLAAPGPRRIIELFAKRSSQEGISAAESTEAARLLSDWRSGLASLGDEVSKSQLIEAARFLGRLIEALNPNVG